MPPAVLRLGCRNFRSYRTLTLNFSSRFVVFYGKNGAGKTNILEAISLFSSGRGCRGCLMSDCANFNTEFGDWSLDLVSEKNNYKTFLDTGFYNNRRFGKIDGNTVFSLNDFEEFVWVLWVIPSMDTVFIGSKTDRRKFFDHLVSGYNKKYKTCLKKIQDLQKERMNVLVFRNDESWLNVLEERIAEESVFITKARFEFIEQLNKVFNKCPSGFLRPNVSISGKIETLVEIKSEEEAVLEIAELLKSCRQDDLERKITTSSVTRSSWFARHPKSNLEAENCSTGEQKAFLISLVLAVARIYQESRQGVPVLLLDDLMMHLDTNRRKMLAKELLELNVQTFLTGTEPYLFEDLKNIAQIFYVENSICSEMQSLENIAV